MSYIPEDPNTDGAHHPHDVSKKKKGHRLSVLHTVVEALLLAAVAILAAWSGYQAARWGGQSALYYGESTTDRVTATQLSTLGTEYQLFDGATLNAWLAATAQGKAGLAAFYVRRFSPPYRIAFDAWLKTDPLHNPNAPPGPGDMPQYHNPQMDQANTLNNEASAMFAKGTSMGGTADKYVRATILLGTVLFVVALRERFTHARVRIALLLLGVVGVAFAMAEIATYPIA